MLFICLLHEFSDDISAGVPEGDYATNITFISQWFVSAFVEDLLLDFHPENTGKGYNHLSAYGGSVQLFPFVELERVFFPGGYSLIWAI